MRCQRRTSGEAVLLTTGWWIGQHRWDKGRSKLCCPAQPPSATLARAALACEADEDHSCPVRGFGEAACAGPQAGGL